MLREGRLEMIDCGNEVTCCHLSNFPLHRVLFLCQGDLIMMRNSKWVLAFGFLMVVAWATTSEACCHRRRACMPAPCGGNAYTTMTTDAGCPCGGYGMMGGGGGAYASGQAAAYDATGGGYPGGMAATSGGMTGYPGGMTGYSGGMMGYPGTMAGYSGGMGGYSGGMGGYPAMYGGYGGYGAYNQGGYGGPMSRLGMRRGWGGMGGYGYGYGMGR